MRRIVSKKTNRAEKKSGDKKCVVTIITSLFFFVWMRTIGKIIERDEWLNLVEK